MSVIFLAFVHRHRDGDFFDVDDRRPARIFLRFGLDVFQSLSSAVLRVVFLEKYPAKTVIERVEEFERYIDG